MSGNRQALLTRLLEATPEQILEMINDATITDLISVPAYTLGFQDIPYNLAEKKQAEYACQVPAIQLTSDNLSFWKSNGDMMTLVSKYIAFWIEPELFLQVAATSANALQRKTTVSAQFGWSIAYNQKLGLNFNRTFNNPGAGGNVGGFINANYSKKGHIGLLPKPTVANFQGPMIKAKAFWSDYQEIHAWITRALKRYLESEGGVDITQLRGMTAPTPGKLPTVSVPNKGPQIAIRGEFDTLMYDLQSDEEHDQSYACDPTNEYGAEAYTQNRHSGFGTFMKKVGKNVGRAGLAVARIAEPEFAPLYNIADTALNQISGHNLGDDQRTWAPRGTDRVTRNYVEEQMPNLASRPVYHRYKNVAEDDGAHVFDRAGKEVMTTMSTVLPQIMAEVAAQIEGEDEADWAMSLISPFNAGAKGARIPVVQSTKTVTSTAYSDLGAFSVDVDKQALMFTNFTSLNQEPWILLNGLPTNCQLSSPQVVNVVCRSVEPGLVLEGPSGLLYQAQYLSLGTPDTAYLTGALVGDKPNTESMFASVKLAAAGLRYFKTSASTNESGIIKAIYQDRGAAVTKNLAQLMNYYQDDDTHVRVYTAANAMATSMGKTGFLLQANYQPVDLRECQSFADARSITISNVTKMMNGQWAQLDHYSPIRLLIKFSVAPDEYLGETWNTTDFYLVNDLIVGAIPASTTTVVLSEFGIDGYSLACPHITVQSFEGISTASTFEFQFVQHFEGIPSSSSQFFETKQAVLGIDYASPLDILRHFKFSDFMVGEGMLMNDPNSVMVRGENSDYGKDTYAAAIALTKEMIDGALACPNNLLSLVDPQQLHDLQDVDDLYSGFGDTIAGKFLQKAGSFGARAMDYLRRNKTVKRLLMQAVPKIIGAVSRKVGLSDNNKERLEKLARSTVEHHMQGEEEPVAEDLSGRYKIQHDALQIMQSPADSKFY